MTGYGDPKNLTPHYLIDRYFDTNVPVETRVVLAAAIRNPDWSVNQLAQFTDTSPTTVHNATAAFYRGTVDQRGKRGWGTGEMLADEERTLDDLTTKQRAVVEFYARYPDVHDEGWTGEDVINFIADRSGIDLTSAYAVRIRDRFGDLIDEHHEKLADDGTLDELPDVPERLDEVPTEIREILRSQLDDTTIPDENLDAGHGEFGEDDWIEPYAAADLHVVDPSTLPHASSDPVPTWLDEEQFIDALDTAQTIGIAADSLALAESRVRDVADALDVNLWEHLDDEPRHDVDAIDPSFKSTGELRTIVDELSTVDALEALRKKEHNGPNRDQVTQHIDEQIAAVEAGDVNLGGPDADDGDPFDDDGVVEIQRGNATYTGPALGDDSPAPQTILDARRADEDEAEPEATDTEHVPTDEWSEIDERIPLSEDGDSQAAFMSPDEATDAMVESRFDAEEPDEPPASARSLYASVGNYAGAWDALEQRLQRDVRRARREHELYPSDATAARVATLERVLTDLTDLHPDDGGADA